jgi:hypothetical protein
MYNIFTLLFFETNAKEREEKKEREMKRKQRGGKITKERMWEAKLLLTTIKEDKEKHQCCK